MSGIFQWSQNAASNATADSTINWAEGQAPSSINDSARAMMAATAKYRDDTSGMLITGGTSAAYSITSNQSFDTLANFHGKTIFFTPHVTNAVGPVTMTVDGFANIPLRSSPNTELLAGTIIAGTPYGAIYNNTDHSLYLQGFYGSPLNIPLLAGMDHWDTVTPGSNYIFPQGQAISRTTYAAAFARWGTRFGAGDGSTTFNVPDKTGRVSAMMEATATRLTSGAGGVDGGTMGSAGGNQTKTLAVNQIPAGVPSSGNNTINVASNVNGVPSNATAGNVSTNSGTFFGAGNPNNPLVINSPLNSSGSNAISVASTNASQAALPILPPLIVCNYIIRII